MSEWKEYKLGQIGFFNNGVNKDKYSFGHGYPFVNLMDIFDKDTISQIPKGLVDVSQDERWPLLLAIYLPIAVCVGLGVVFVRYLSPVFMKSPNIPVRVLFVLWAAVTLFFPLAVNKVYYTMPFAVVYGVVYLLLSWVMLLLERVKVK